MNCLLEVALSKLFFPDRRTTDLAAFAYKNVTRNEPESVLITGREVHGRTDQQR